MGTATQGDGSARTTDRGERRALWLLSLGAAAGLAVAAASLLSAPSAGLGLPDGVVARVNDTLIRDEEYQRLLAALASDRRSPLSDDDRLHVLDRLIEEELLVQHALDLGLVRTDRRVRADLVSAVLASLNAAADAYEPTPDEVEAFYAENTDYFARPARLWVRDLFVGRQGRSDADALARAREASDRLRADEPLASVREALADAPVAPLPDAPLPPAKLREYLGPSALSTALRLQPGDVSDPVSTPQGYHVLVLVDRAEVETEPLADVENLVRAEMRRRAGDQALRDRLDALRAQADVVVAPEQP
ncbi:MAG: peptidylprolyl isomerase [Myxococcota bacterium]|nr:peptidylprolyl isomerase [Myxococcota bacterium]